LENATTAFFNGLLAAQIGLRLAAIEKRFICPSTTGYAAEEK
jgi:hypothetical protein